MKRLFLCIALALSAFTFTATVQADNYEGFAPADHQSAAIAVNVVAIADCDRCMYAGLGDQGPLIAMKRYNEYPDIKSLIKETDNAWTGYFEVGWRS